MIAPAPAPLLPVQGDFTEQRLWDAPISYLQWGAAAQRCNAESSVNVKEERYCTKTTAKMAAAVGFSSSIYESDRENVMKHLLDAVKQVILFILQNPLILKRHLFNETISSSPGKLHTRYLRLNKWYPNSLIYLHFSLSFQKLHNNKSTLTLTAWVAQRFFRIYIFCTIH